MALPVANRKPPVPLPASASNANANGSEVEPSASDATASQALQDALAVFELVKGATLLKAVKNVRVVV